MPTKVNGGIITDQMLTGKLRYFKMTGAGAGAFTYTVSDGTVTLESQTKGGPDPATIYYFGVGEGRPVPDSLADLAFRVIMEKCTIVEIGVIGDPGAETAIHFSAANTAFGWIDADGNVDVVAMQDAIADTYGPTVDVPAASGAPVTPEGPNVNAPVTATVSTTVTIEEVPFELA